MRNPFDVNHFAHGEIRFRINLKPVSLQNKGEDRAKFKEEVQKTTRHSEYIIVGPCWIAIDYYCKHINRLKRPGVYDIDNIVKPIIDALVGIKGILVDDVLVERVTVNWIDAPSEDYFEVQVKYPGLVFLNKADMVFVKSESGWCLPVPSPLLQEKEHLRRLFALWDSIKSEEDYYKVIYALPQTSFIYYNKIKDKGYRVVNLRDLM